MLKRATAATGLAATFLLASTIPAFAGGWGTVDCAQDPSPYCQLGAGQTGKSPAPGGQGQPDPHRTGKQGAAQPSPRPGDRIVGGDANLAHCSYVRSNYQPPGNGTQTIAFQTHPTGSKGVQLVLALAQGGAWYVYRCTGPGVRDGLYRAPIWMPDGQTPGAAAPLPSPEQMAQRARSQLQLPRPTIVSNPARTQLVTLPTWLWLDRGNWGTQSATASVPGVSVTAVATPTSVSWSMGDGTAVTCTGPGTPFPTGGDPAASSPDCGHSYHQSSASAPGQQFPVMATVHWAVAWSGAGAAGTFPDMTTSANAGFRVEEAQALGTGHR